MWTDSKAIENEAANADFSSTCNWTFGYIKGMSTNTTTVVLIGQLFPDDTTTSPAVGYYTISTPASYVIATGLNRDSAKFLLAEFDAIGSNAATISHPNKRQLNEHYKPR